MPINNTQAPKKIVSILSLGHSGSTVLSAFLARNPDVVTLGEVRGSLGMVAKGGVEKTPHISCSCGTSPHDCPVWGEYINRIDSKLPEMDFSERYLFLLQNRSIAGYKVVVDTSKAIEEWKTLYELSKEKRIDLYTVFLVKDVRAHVVSMRRNDKRKDRKPSSYLLLYLSWYKQNKKIKRTLDSLGVPYVQVSYENFCVDPRAVASAVQKMIGLKTEIGSTKSNHHIARGNPVRNRAEVLTNITYDNVWKQDFRAFLPSILLPFIYLWNKKIVYSEGLVFKKSTNDSSR